MTTIDPVIIQVLAAALFTLGVAIVALRRNIFFLLMGVELMLNAVNLSFVGFARTVPGEASLVGHLTPIFIIAIAAAEACVGLAMVICITRRRDEAVATDSDAYSDLRE